MEPETQLPLTNPQTCVQVNNVLDLSKLANTDWNFEIKQAVGSGNRNYLGCAWFNSELDTRYPDQRIFFFFFWVLRPSEQYIKQNHIHFNVSNLYGSHPLCYLLNKPTYYVKHNAGFVSVQILPLHVCCMFLPFLRPSSSMSIQKSYKRRYNKIKSKGPFCTFNDDGLRKGWNMVVYYMTGTTWIEIKPALCSTK